MVDARFARKLYDSDPEFAAFAKNVLGAGSADEFLSKMNPDAADVGTSGGIVKRRRKKRIRKKWGRKENAALLLVGLPTGALVGSQISKPKDDLDIEPHKGSMMQGFGKSIDGDCEFTKVDTDKRQVFGWASITHVNGEPVVDRQGDVVTLEEVEKSAYDYVVKSRVGGSQHKRDGDKPFHAADLIESFVVTEDKAKAMGLGDDVPQGWWVGFKVNDDDTWAKVKNGDVTGFSVHGRGKRQQIEGELTPSEVVDG